MIDIDLCPIRRALGGKCEGCGNYFNPQCMAARQYINSKRETDNGRILQSSDKKIERQ